MSDKVLIKLSVIALCCLFSKPSLAMADARQWVEQIRRRKIELGNFPVKVLFIEKLQPNNDIYPLSINPDIFNRTGYMEIISLENLSWSFKLNRLGERQPPSSNQYIRTFSLFANLAGVDTLVYAPALAMKWSLLTLENKRLRKFTKSFPYTELRPSNVYRWMFDLLGYNGVVLDERKGQLLVGSAQREFKVFDQAVVYQGSSRSSFLPKDSKNAAAIIECISAHKGYGVFKTILQKGQIEIGDKVAIVAH